MRHTPESSATPSAKEAPKRKSHQLFYQALPFILASLIFFLFQFPFPLPFSKERWSYEADVKVYPYRARMLDSLMEKHLSTGMSKKAVIQLLGKPDHSASDHFTYDIEKSYYGMDVDPNWGRYLYIRFDGQDKMSHAEVRTFGKKD